MSQSSHIDSFPLVNSIPSSQRFESPRVDAITGSRFILDEEPNGFTYDSRYGSSSLVLDDDVVEPEDVVVVDSRLYSRGEENPSHLQDIEKRSTEEMEVGGSALERADVQRRRVEAIGGQVEFGGSDRRLSLPKAELINRHPTQRRRVRTTKRDLCALRFLMNIPKTISSDRLPLESKLFHLASIRNEDEVSLETRRNASQRLVNDADNEALRSDSAPVFSPSENMRRRNRRFGNETFRIRSPEDFSPQCEEDKINANHTSITFSRMILSRSGPFCSPIAVISFLPIRSNSGHLSASIPFNPLDTLVEKRKKTSYGHLLCADQTPYDPFFLDDPEMTAGSRRSVRSLISFISSTIPWMREEDLKNEMEHQFSEKHHHWLRTDISLSKIRKAKKLAASLAFGESPRIELAAVGAAFVYFERLVLRNLITRSNANVAMAACLLVAFKFIDPESRIPEDLSQALQGICEVFRISRARVVEYEVPVLVGLDFRLLVDQDEFFPHFRHILASQALTPQEYLGEALYSEFFPDG